MIRVTKAEVKEALGERGNDKRILYMQELSLCFQNYR